MDTNKNASFVPSVLCDLCTDKILDGKKLTIVQHRDVICLLEEKRLSQLDPQFVKEITSSLSSQSDDPISISDDDLFTYCKSRYINNLTDIANYSEGMDKIKDKFSAEIEQIASDLRNISSRSKNDNSSDDDD